MNLLADFIRSRRFAPLFGTQFLGAFNDNLYKTALFVMISYYGLAEDELLPPAQLLNVGALLFILPYFLFSALSGQLANKYDRGRLARMIKLMEVGVMGLAVVGFLQHSLWLLLLCLFLMGLQSTLFGPLKYAILPDYLHEDELLLGNSLIEGGTFLAILLGQIVGTILAGVPALWVASLVVIVALLGLASSGLMPRVAAKTPQEYLNFHIWQSSLSMLRAVLAQADLRAAILGISWFWLVGAVYTTQLPTFTRLHLGGNEAVFNLMLALFSIGIGAGSILCARLSHGQLNLAWVALGNVGMAIFGLMLVMLTKGAHYEQYVGIASFLLRGEAWAVMLCIVLLGFFGGFFSVPLYTWLQTAAGDEGRAFAVAANNIVNGLFMVAAALMSVALLWLFDNISLLYLLVALGQIIMLVVLWRLTPDLKAGLKLWLGK